MPVDLTVLTDDELALAFDELCERVADCHPDDRRGHHDALMLCCQEYNRRAEAWINERAATT